MFSVPSVVKNLVSQFSTSISTPRFLNCTMDGNSEATGPQIRFESLESQLEDEQTSHMLQDIGCGQGLSTFVPDSLKTHVTDTQFDQEEFYYEDAPDVQHNDIASQVVAAPIKTTWFTRPESSNEEVGAGFSYQKATKQTLNMGRKAGNHDGVSVEASGTGTCHTE